MVAEILTEIVPWVTAAAVTLTLRLITTVPVRELITTRAAASPGETSRFSIMLKKDTLCDESAGAVMATETPSSAFAVPSPKATLIASVIALAVEKSDSRMLSTICSALSNGDSTIRSTVAPFGIRPDVGTPICILLPAASAETPLTVNAPWATA